MKQMIILSCHILNTQKWNVCRNDLERDAHHFLFDSRAHTWLSFHNEQQYIWVITNDFLLFYNPYSLCYLLYVRVHRWGNNILISLYAATNLLRFKWIIHERMRAVHFPLQLNWIYESKHVLFTICVGTLIALKTNK